MENYIFFDIGAGWGENSLARTESDPSVLTWAFDPMLQSFSFLQNSSINFKERYTAVQTALGDFDGTAEFFIQNDANTGYNSLKQFDAEVIAQHWFNIDDSSRSTELTSSSSITVPVARLETWIQNNQPNLTKIDYFQCNAEGNDLSVLEGMGNYINLIQAGEIRCSRPNRSCYSNFNNNIDDIILFLISKNFSITNATQVDHLDNQIQVHFEKAK